MNTNNSVPIGPTTAVGWAASALGLGPSVVNQLVAFFENNSAHLTSSEEVMLIAGAVILIVTHLGRYAQAHKLIPQSIPIPQLPSEDEEAVDQPPASPVSVRPESAVVPDGAATGEAV